MRSQSENGISSGSEYNRLCTALCFLIEQLTAPQAEDSWLMIQILTRCPSCDIVPNRSLPIFYLMPIILSSPKKKINNKKDVSLKELLQIIDDHLNFPNGKFVNRMAY